MSEKLTRVGVLEYSVTARTWVRLNRYYDISQLGMALSRIETTKGITKFDKPLTEGLSLFSRQHGGRDNVPNVFVLFTDGKSGDKVNFEEPARALKEIGTTIITVGIGKSAVYDELKRIASEGYVLRVNSFDELGEIAGQLGSLACKGMLTHEYLA